MKTKLRTFECQECLKMKVGSRFASISKDGNGKVVGKWICQTCYLKK